VASHYVGHPYFDELPEQHLDTMFLAEHRSGPGPIIGLLPGSRNQEVERNLSTLARSAAMIHAARPDTRFLVACFQGIASGIRGRLLESFSARRSACLSSDTSLCRPNPEIIELSHACIAVSGSVGLELSIAAGLPS